MRRPVVRLDFGSGHFDDPGCLREDVAAQLAAFERREGTPSEDIPSLDGLRSDDALLSKFDVREMAPEALLFQSGYLTIRGEEAGPMGAPVYRLGYRNHEVRWSLNASLLAALTPPDSAQGRPDPRVSDWLRAGDLAGGEALVRGLFAGIPYEWHTRNDIARYEGYYDSAFYAWLAAQGLDVAVEESGGAGRTDPAVRCGGERVPVRAQGGGAGGGRARRCRSCGRRGTPRSTAGRRARCT